MLITRLVGRQAAHHEDLVIVLTDSDSSEEGDRFQNGQDNSGYRCIHWIRTPLSCVRILVGGGNDDRWWHPDGTVLRERW